MTKEILCLRIYLKNKKYILTNSDFMYIRRQLIKVKLSNLNVKTIFTLRNGEKYWVKPEILKFEEYAYIKNRFGIDQRNAKYIAKILRVIDPERSIIILPWYLEIDNVSSKKVRNSKDQKKRKGKKNANKKKKDKSD